MEKKKKNSQIHLRCDCRCDVITTPTLLLHGMASCWIDGRGEIVPNDEPPTEPRGVVKNDIELAVSSSLSESRLRNTFNLLIIIKIHSNQIESI